MKIAYVCHWNPFVEDGVVRKIRSQASVWSELGAQVQIFSLSAAPTNGDSRQPQLLGRRFLYRNPYVGRARETMRLTRAVDRWAPDVVYLRYSLFLPPPVHLMRAVPTVIEINSDDRAEYGYRTRFLAGYNTVNRHLLFAKAKGFVGVTPELAERTAPENRRARRIAITNGINLFDGVPLAPSQNTRPRLVFLGAAEPWHGVDKIVWLASALPEFDFEIVGSHGSTDGPVPENVRVHGFLERQAYETILARSDVALGTLALHRIGVSQAAPLKVREYLLRGMPIVIGYDDPDLRDEPWFVLRLPNTESNVRHGVARIRDFVLSVTGRRVSRDEVAHRIDVLIKEKQRLAFIEEIAANGSGA